MVNGQHYSQLEKNAFLPQAPAFHLVYLTQIHCDTKSVSKEWSIDFRLVDQNWFNMSDYKEELETGVTKSAGRYGYRRHFSTKWYYRSSVGNFKYQLHEWWL